MEDAAMAEPQITEIASYFATHLPSDGVESGIVRDGWRRAIRLARQRGEIRWLTDLVSRQDPQDGVLQAHCEALHR
jgi:hypothetical protein